MRNSIAAATFRIVQVLLSPLACIAYVDLVVTLVTFSRKSGTPATVHASTYIRWMLHKLGTRSDEPCMRLMSVVPNVRPWALYLVTCPTLLAHRVTGYVPRVYRYPYEGEPSPPHQAAARTTFFDKALERRLPGIKQLVVLGAGLDTRALRLPSSAGVRVYEVDAPKAQTFKLEMLKKAGLEANRATYVSADFLKEDWLEKLVAAGFQRDKPTFFLWEGVTMYLTREAVESTLRKIGGTSKGSVVAFDYFSKAGIQSRSLSMRYLRAFLSATGEPWRFGIDNTPPVRERVAAFVESCGLVLEEQRNFGEETARKRAPAGFATAVVQ